MNPVNPSEPTAKKGSFPKTTGWHGHDHRGMNPMNLFSQCKERDVILGGSGYTPNRFIGFIHSNTSPPSRGFQMNPFSGLVHASREGSFSRWTSAVASGATSGPMTPGQAPWSAEDSHVNHYKTSGLQVH